MATNAFPGAASDLASAYNQLNPRLGRHPPANDLKRLYEQRTYHSNLDMLLEELDLAVRADGAPLHALYVGPSGCGKSMDLAWLAREILRRPKLAGPVLPIHFGIGEEIGLHEVTFTELALALTLRLRTAAPEVIGEKDLQTVVQWLYGEHFKERVEQVDMKAGFGAALAGILSAALSGQVTRKDTLRVTLQPQMPELLHILTGLIDKFQDGVGKIPLFIIDDLEKITPVDEALGLFLNQGRFLAELPCHLILTAPNALTLQDRYTQEVLTHFKEYRVVLPWPGTDKHLTAEAEVLRRIIYRRMAPHLVDPGALDHAIAQTGGIVAQLIEVMQRSALEAKVVGARQIGEPHVDKALRVEQIRYSSMLKPEDFEVLEVIGTHGLPSDVKRPALLHNLSVLEYPDSPTWVAAHPLVLPLVERWRTFEDERARLRAANTGHAPGGPKV